MAEQTGALRARAYRDVGKWWTIEIPELRSPGPRGTTIIATGGAVTTRGIEQAARELAAVWLDLDESDVDVEVTIEAPRDVLDLWREGEREEAEARSAVLRAAAKRRDAVRALRADGYTLEAVAHALGISVQRAGQLSAVRR